MTVRAVRHYWWEAELSSSVEKHLHTLWPRGRGSLKLAARCLQHHLPPSLRELPRLQGHRQDHGGTIGTVVLLGVSSCWLPAGRRAWCLLMWWFFVRHELCHSPSRWCPSRSRQICCFLTATTLLRHALSFEICFKSCFFLNFSNFFTTLL